MNIDRFLNILSASIGSMGALFLAIGVLVLSDKDMVHGTFNYSPMGWPSNEIISSMAIQKGHTQIGVTYILIAFLLQVVCLIFLKDEVGFVKSRLNGTLLAGGLVIILAIVACLADKGLCEYHKLNMKKIVARDYLESNIKERESPLYADVQTIANQYFSFKKTTEENGSDFIKRFAKHVGYDLPKDANFSKFK